MGRLTCVKPRVSAIRVGPASLRDPEGHSRALEPWRKWYSLAAWTALRLRVFVRDGFTCRKCGRLEGDTSRLVGDHVKEHNGDPVLFWDEDNVQTLCKPCHDSAKQAEEKARRVGAFNARRRAARA